VGLLNLLKALFRAGSPPPAPRRLDGRSKALSCETAPQQRGTVDGRLDATRGSVQQTNVKCMFHGGNRLRNSGLRHTKMNAGLGRAAVLDCGKQNVQVAKC
jgi:hypothetical protein